MLGRPAHLREAHLAYSRPLADEYGSQNAAGVALLVTAAEGVQRLRAS
jgi:hypothetical protein